MGFCKRCFMEFKQAWHKKNPGKLFNVNMKDVIFKCQLVLYDSNSYGEQVVRVFDCKKKQYDTMTPSEYQEKKKKGLVP